MRRSILSQNDICMYVCMFIFMYVEARSHSAVAVSQTGAQSPCEDDAAAFTQDEVDNPERFANWCHALNDSPEFI